jgi:hypothetical protein
MCADDDVSVAVQPRLPNEPKIFALVHELKHHYCDREKLGAGVIHCGDYDRSTSGGAPQGRHDRAEVRAIGYHAALQRKASACGISTPRLLHQPPPFASSGAAASDRQPAGGTLKDCDGTW